MPEDAWQQRNLRGIKKRLAWLSGQPDGLLCARKTARRYAAILKEGREVQLYFVDAETDLAKPTVHGVMSRLDLEAPLHLLSDYAQALLLALVWNPRPMRILILGFGGGRIPMVLHHHFPEARLECVEIEPEIIELSQNYFGVELDPRLSVSIGDGRQYLEEATAEMRYDIILVDCFTGVKETPSHLATAEFYELCRRRLAEGGVLGTYFIGADPLLDEKAGTFARAFRQVLEFAQGGSHVLLGCERPNWNLESFVAAARELDQHHGFSFSLAEKAKAVRLLDLTNRFHSRPLLPDNPPNPQSRK